MSRRRRLGLALTLGLLTATLAAGCLGGGGGASDGAGTASGSEAGGPADGNGSAPGAGPEGPADANLTLPALDPPENRTLYLTGAMGLQPTVPPSGSVAIPGGPGNVAVDGDIAVFESEPLDEPAILSPGGSNLTLWLEADTPKVSNGVIDLGVWFGSTRGIHHVGGGSIDGRLLLPGEPTKVRIPIPNQGNRGAYVPAGESLQVHVVQLMSPRGVEDVNILVGGTNASRVDVTTRTVNVAPVRTTTAANSTTIEGTIPASSDALGCDAREGVTTRTHPVSAGADASRLEFSIQAQDTPAREDLDMFLRDGGTTVLGTGSIDASENLLLAGPTLDGLRGRDLTLRVVACSAHATSYTVTVEQG